MLSSSTTSPPLVIAHSGLSTLGSANDANWLRRFTAQLQALHIPYWADVKAGDDTLTCFRAALRNARVVVILVSADLLKTELCEPITERLHSAGRRNPLTIRPILVQSCVEEGEPLLREVRPINKQALASLASYDEQERYLAETALRVQELLKGAFRLEVRDLLSERPKDVSGHLDQIICLLEQVGPYLDGALGSVQDIGAYLLQELLGSGSMVVSTEDEAGIFASGTMGRLDRQELELIDRVIKKLVAVCRRAPSRAEQRVYDEIRTVCLCLRLLTDSTDPKVVADTEESWGLEAPLELLPSWVLVAQAADEVGASAVAKETFEARWRVARNATLRLLPSYLATQHGKSGKADGRPLPLVRIFHGVWFCLLLLKRFPPSELKERQALAYVLREGLRFLCFGYEDNEEQRRPYYYFDALRYTQALCILVAYHAGRVLGKSFDQTVLKFLESIARTEGVNRYVPAEHLQHILEIYLAGNFMLFVRLTGQPGCPTVAAQLLREQQCDEHRLTQVQQAFILSALFHDVGNLFIPSSRPEVGDFGLDSPELDEDLTNLLQGRRTSIQLLARKCVVAVQPYVEKATTEPDLDLRNWLVGQQERPGHGLLGAYYLLRVTANRGLDEWVLRSSVRAILLHNALSVRLCATLDPIAALLVLFDELYEWDPGQPISARLPGKSLQVIAPDLPAHEPRDRWIRSKNLRLTQTDEDGLEAWLDVDPQDPTAGWPTFDIQLQGPQRLALPVYQLWLRKSQNLGRILRAKSGFCPRLVMTSAIARSGITNRQRVEKLIAELKDSSTPGGNDSKSIMERWFKSCHIEVREHQETICLDSFDPDLALCRDLPQVLARLRKQAPPMRVD